MDVYGYYLATAIIYGLLLGGVLLLGCVKKCFFPYIHLGIASVCGIINQALIISPIILQNDYYRDIFGFVYVRMLFLSIQYLAMFLIPVYVAHRRSKLIKDSKKKLKTVRILVVCGYFIAFVAIVLLIASLVSIGTIYVSSATYAYLYLVYTVIHWLLIILCFIVAILLRSEIPNIGSFVAFGFFIMLMMIGTTTQLFADPYESYSTVFNFLLVYIFLYHVCCYLGILICAFFGPHWVQDITRLEVAETTA